MLELQAEDFSEAGDERQARTLLEKAHDLKIEASSSAACDPEG